MKPSIKLAVLAVVILCCVHGEVAGKNRGKCVKKGRTRATQDIRDDHRSMFMADSGVWNKRRGKVRSFSLSTKRSVRVKSSWDISQ